MWEDTVYMESPDFDKLEAQRIICLFLAQDEDPEKPHKQLGFETAQSAFKEIGELFGRKKNTIKNERDAFDFYTDSSRVGWKANLKPSLDLIWKKYGDISREKLLQMSLNFIGTLRDNKGMPQLNIFNEVANLDVKTELKPPDDSNIVEFSNMQQGRKQQWHIMSVDQILECLEDYKKPEFQSEDTPHRYNDDHWRDLLYKHHLSNKVLRTLAGTQGSAVFSVFAKLIQVANDLPIDHKVCPIDVELLDVTITRIKNDMKSYVYPPRSNWVGRSPRTKNITVKQGGKNIIFYGAPGTGKSTEIKNRIGSSPNVTTVFHPDMQNSDFIGALKPTVHNKNVTYEFSPGPFAKSLCSAYKEPEQNVYLIIEELNRAPAMAVFGELFQLLDREDNGESTDQVDFPSDEFQTWMNRETNMVHTHIKLPSNFSIYASMNSADQGVYPLDTAFRRRWEQEYIPIDWGKGLEAELIIINTDGSEARVSWKVLGKAINAELEEQYAEDRLLGQWWINNRDIQNGNGLVPSKLLSYLWDDLLRHDDDMKKNIFKPDIKRFGQLMQRNHRDSKQQIFSDDFLQKIVY